MESERDEQSGWRTIARELKAATSLILSFLSGFVLIFLLAFDVWEGRNLYYFGFPPPTEFAVIHSTGEGAVVVTFPETDPLAYGVILLVLALVQICAAWFLWKEWRRW